VILMDINLPGISGLTALKILAGDAATAHIPVVALSANAMPRDIEKGLEAGFFRYLTKPILGQRIHGHAGPGPEGRARQTAPDRRRRGQPMTIETDIQARPHPGRRRPGRQRAAADAAAARPATRRSARR
jgi:PleD family two-component response regulator